MGSKNTSPPSRLLDAAHAKLQGQDRVNAEIFTAIEIVARKLERTEAERDRLARRLALIESAASIDEKTGKFYLPAVVDPAQLPQAAPSVTPRWMIASTMMSAAVALFALGAVVMQPSPQVLSKEQLAIIDSLKLSQFALATPDKQDWKEASSDAAQHLIKSAQLPDAEELAAQERAAENLTLSDKPAPASPPEDITASVAAAPEPEAEKIAEPEKIAEAAIAVPERAVAPAPAPAPAPASESESEPAAAVAPKPEAPKEKEVVAAAPVAPAPEPVKVPVAKAPVASKLAASTNLELDPDTSLPEKISELEKRALQGNAEAQHDLATIYASGKMIPQDYKRAIYWFAKSADGGVANANYNLGVIFQQGLGVKSDMRQAINWYEKAAELGHPEAMYNLGIAFIEGVGAKPNIQKGISYFKRAANAGVAQAAFNLGVIYESNFTGAPDKAKANEWYKMAAKEGHMDARTALDRLAGNAVTPIEQAVTLADRIEPAAGGDVQAPAPQFKADLLSKVQVELIRQGLLSGKANGVMDMQTEEAIRSYQKKLGMVEDGQPSAEFLDKISSLTTNN